MARLLYNRWCDIENGRGARSRKEVSMKFARASVCFIILASWGLVGAAFPAEKIVQSQWATTPIRLDGTNQEWQDATLRMDKTSKAEYALRNDGEFLYILFVFKSLPALSTYEMSGMKVYYALAGKKDKSIGFHFIKRSLTADELIANMEKGGQVLTEEKKAEIRKQKGYMTYVGEPIDPEKAAEQLAAGKVELPTFRDRLSPRVSVVEFRIPLARLVEAGATAAPGASIKLGFEWGGMTKEMRSAYMARQASAGAQARGTGGGDFGQQLSDDYQGNEGAGGSAMGGRPDPRTRKHSFWIDVKLAAQGN
jgi:hypothetical protein